MSEQERVVRLTLIDWLIAVLSRDDDERAPAAVERLREQRNELAPAQVVGLDALTLTGEQA